MPLDRRVGMSDEYYAIQDHPFFVSLLQTGKYDIIHGYDVVDDQKEHSLTAGILIGPGKIADAPITLLSSSREIDATGTCEMYTFYHVGPRVCGHKGIVHGGLLASIVDESFCRCGFPLLPSKLGVTASLELKYLAPTPADSFIVVHAQTVKHEGRKVWVEGEVLQIPESDEYDPQAELVKSVKASLLLVEPRYVSKLDRKISHKPPQENGEHQPSA